MNQFPSTQRIVADSSGSALRRYKWQPTVKRRSTFEPTVIPFVLCFSVDGQVDKVPSFCDYSIFHSNPPHRAPHSHTSSRFIDGALLTLHFLPIRRGYFSLPRSFLTLLTALSRILPDSTMFYDGQSAARLRPLLEEITAKFVRASGTNPAHRYRPEFKAFLQFLIRSRTQTDGPPRDRY